MKLTSEQTETITTRKSLAVIASAGMGKTTVLTERFLYCHKERGAPLESLLAFTFTEKASREMQKRILESGKLRYEDAPSLHISTIHAFCHRVITENATLIGLRPDFEVLDQNAAILWLSIQIDRFLAEKLTENNKAFTTFLKYYGYSNLRKTIHDLTEVNLTELSESELRCHNPETELKNEDFTAFLFANRELQKILSDKKKNDNLLTYDDLETLCLKLFNEHPAVLKKLQRRFEHILVDEYQDVSPRQFSLIKSLYHPETNELFIVGDPKQSIYGFRNADVRLFLETAKLIENHGGKTVTLSQTFRTPLNLQNYFNEVFPQVLPDHLYHHVHTEKIDSNSALYAVTVVAKSEDESNAEGRHIERAEEIAGLIHELVKTGTSEQEIAILFPTKKFFTLYQQALSAKGIKTVTESFIGYLDNPLPLLCWHILNYLAGTRNKITQVGILRNPLFGFSEAFIHHLVKNETPDIFVEHTLDLFVSHREREQWNRLCKNVKEWQVLSKTLFATELLQTIAKEICPNPSADEMILMEKWTQLFTSWQKQELYFTHQLTQLLRDFEELDASHSMPNVKTNGVWLLTVHAAKGLEFDHVFIVPTKGRPATTPIFLFNKDQGFVFKIHDDGKEKALKYELDESDCFKATKESQQRELASELTRQIYVALTRSKKCLYFFPDRPAQTLLKTFEKNPADTSSIKNFNEWIYWLSQVASPAHLKAVSQFKAPPVETVQNPEIALHTDSVSPENTHKGTYPILTVTELETLAHCPKKFELKYLNQIRPLRQLATFPFLAPTATTKAKLSPREKGNLFHEILQYYDFHAGNNLDEVIDQALFNQHLTDVDNTIRTECHFFISRLKQDALFRSILFENSESREEIEFILKLKQFSLSGQIDKLVQLKNSHGEISWMIVDFKTHHAQTPEARKRLMEEFAFQMSCYALAICKILKLDRIDTLVLFTSGPSYEIMHHTTDSLNAFENRLNEIYSTLNLHLHSNEFALTVNQDTCPNCGYFKDNYCGVKGE